MARSILARPCLAALILACALILRLSIPTGYMLGGASGLSLRLCPAAMGDAAGPSDMMAAMPGMDQAGGHHHGGHGKDPGACPFAAVSIAALCAAFVVRLLAAMLERSDPPPIAAALSRRSQADHLRPPSRGPPSSNR